MPETAPQTLLGFDFGLKRIGVALGMQLTHTARPLETIVRTGRKNDYWPRVEALLQEWRPDCVLLGWPADENDPAAPLLRDITRFGNQLRTRAGMRVELVNEAYSSIEAAQRLREQRQAGRSRRVSKAELDSMAAVIIIETWFSQPQSN